MNVLLVEPPKKTWGVMGDYIAPPLGLAQLAAHAEICLKTDPLFSQITIVKV